MIDDWVVGDEPGIKSPEPCWPVSDRSISLGNLKIIRELSPSEDNIAQPECHRLVYVRGWSGSTFELFARSDSRRLWFAIPSFDGFASLRPPDPHQRVALIPTVWRYQWARRVFDGEVRVRFANGAGVDVYEPINARDSLMSIRPTVRNPPLLPGSDISLANCRSCCAARASRASLLELGGELLARARGRGGTMYELWADPLPGRLWHGTGWDSPPLHLTPVESRYWS